MYHVILAGGSGTRFWPQSRNNTPKQLLKILGNETMIRLTYNRLCQFAVANEIFVVASEKLSKLIQEEIPEIPNNNYIIEPTGKNTAPAIGLAAIHITKRDANAIMAVYPSDHLIVGDNNLKKIIIDANKMANETSSLITIGIKPTYPATGYGYIQYDVNKQQNIAGIYKVKAFTEKPNQETAKKFINSSEYLWNAGMFVWKANNILFAIKTFMPDLHIALKMIYNTLDTSKYATILNEEWKMIQPESIDYGILEKADNVYTIEADFQWNDLGTWFSLFNVKDKNENNSYYDGEVISVQSENNLVISPNRLTAIIGIKDMVVINLDDATLVVPHDKCEDVKNIVDMLKTMNKSKYL